MSLYWRAVVAIWVIVVVQLICLAYASAQELPYEPAPAGDVDVPPGPNVIVVLAEGARAPFGGQLFDPATALRWGNRTTRYRMSIRLLTEELRVCHEEHSASTTRQLDLQAQSYVREIGGLRTDIRDQAARYEGELQRFRSPPFYETWGFAFGMGAIVTAIVGGLVAGLAAGL